MSPELETLDQLLGGELPLRTIRGLFPTTEVFNTAMQWMLSCGDVRLFDDKGKELPRWAWRDIFSGELDAKAALFMLDLTEQGARKL